MRKDEMDYDYTDERIRGKKKKKKDKRIGCKKEKVPGKPQECSFTPYGARCESKKRSPAIHVCSELGCIFTDKITL